MPLLPSRDVCREPNMMQQAEHELCLTRFLTKWPRGSLIRRDLALTCLQTLELPLKRHLGV